MRWYYYKLEGTEKEIELRRFNESIQGVKKDCCWNFAHNWWKNWDWFGYGRNNRLFGCDGDKKDYESEVWIIWRR